MTYTAKHLQTLAVKLAAVPELQPALDIIANDPAHSAYVYECYTQLIKDIPTLKQDELQRIKEAQTILRRRQGESGSASTVIVNDILSALGNQKDILSVTAEESTNQNSPYYQPALNELVKRMVGGHQLKLQCKSPSDFDPESLKVIWGHTLITDPEALLHFTICHYLERYISEALIAASIGLARQKDFLINAMVDVIILDNIQNKNTQLFQTWVTSKPEGGLGWITEDRLSSYSN